MQPFGRPRTAAVIVLAVLAVAAISWLDREVRGYSFTLMFLLPVVAATLAAGRRSGLILALVATIGWLLSRERLAPTPVLAWNFTTRLIMYAGAAVLLASLRREHDRLRASRAQLASALRVLEHEVPPLAERILTQLTRFRGRSAEVDRLVELVAPTTRAIRFVAGDFLALRALGRDTLHLERRSLDLSTLLLRVLEERTDRAQALLAVPDQDVFVSGDPERLAQALGSLVTGGLSVIGADRPVSMKLRDGGREALVEIRIGDPGAGPEGGIGGEAGFAMELARLIIEAHEGKLELRHYRAGLAAQVDVILPLGNAPDRGPARVAVAELWEGHRPAS